MDFTNIILDGIEQFNKVYAIILRKPYITARVQYTPRRDRSGKVTQEMLAFTIINEGFLQIEVQRVWFLTSFNRPVFSELLDSKMPLKISGRDRFTYFVPMKELKAALNRSIGETIAQAVVLDSTEHRFTGRADKVAQAEFAK
jgi:hypothetical protein